MTISGYKPTAVPSRLAIEWTSLPAFSDDLQLATCGQCSSGCSRCKCDVNKLSCTFYCQCKAGACTNQSNILSDEENGNELMQSTGAISESDCSDSGDERLFNSPMDVNKYPPLLAVQHTVRTNRNSLEHIHLDHSYHTLLSNDDDWKMTPQPRNSTNNYLSDSSADSPRSMRNSNNFSTPNPVDAQEPGVGVGVSVSLLCSHPPTLTPS
ncbi:unnamed protein product [Adineta ricciae]|uniref:Tesmin/TSO1-like CXC domain-containing protein n=1 Tax=Adineta ricciae TaxID=249248 RepID=A0A815MCK6_ADIRI|nr:unnamed protein product [Adineta ricciae]